MTRDMTDNKTLNETLRRLLATNIVCFTYKKVNGEIRKAKGTRNLDLARAHTGESIPSPTGYEQPNSYYDVESLGWRSYREGNLISIDGVVARTDTDFAKKPTSPNEPKKGELPKREIRKVREEIRKSWEELDKDIEIVPLTGKSATEDFARLVARYVVDEIVERLAR